MNGFSVMKRGHENRHSQPLAFLRYTMENHLEHLHQTQNNIRNPAKNRFKLLQMAGEERSRRIKISNGGDWRKTGK